MQVTWNGSLSSSCSLDLWVSVFITMVFVLHVSAVGRLVLWFLPWNHSENEQNVRFKRIISKKGDEHQHCLQYAFLLWDVTIFSYTGSSINHLGSKKSKLTSDQYKTQGWTSSCLLKDVSAGFNFTLIAHWRGRGLSKYCRVNVCALMHSQYM